MDMAFTVYIQIIIIYYSKYFHDVMYIICTSLFVCHYIRYVIVIIRLLEYILLQEYYML